MPTLIKDLVEAALESDIEDETVAALRASTLAPHFNNVPRFRVALDSSALTPRRDVSRDAIKVGKFTLKQLAPKRYFYVTPLASGTSSDTNLVYSIQDEVLIFQ